MNKEEIIPSIANILGIIYNIPLITNTIRIGKADDISLSFLILRLIVSILWIVYSIELINYQILVSNIPSVISSGILLYFKGKTFYIKIKQNKQSSFKEINENETELPESSELPETP